LNTLFVLKDCSEKNVTYGVLIIKAEVTQLEVEIAISNIKADMDDELETSFTINEHILPKLPWEVELVKAPIVTV
jgi:hypothetical protein